MNLQNRNGFRDIENELTVAKGEGLVSKFGVDMYTWLYFKWIINKELLYSSWNSAQKCGSLDESGLGEANGYMYMDG